MRISLLAEGSTPLEVIAIDQIINNHIQVIRSGRELERFEPTEDNQASSKHWVRVHNAAQARLIRAVNWLTKLRKVKVDDVIKRKQNKLINFESEFAQSLKNIDKQMDVLERLEDGEDLTDEELGIETSEPKPKSQISIEIREMLAKLRENLTFEYDGEEEETLPDQASTS